MKRRLFSILIPAILSMAASAQPLESNLRTKSDKSGASRAEPSDVSATADNPLSFLQVLGTTSQTALFSTTTNPNNIIIKGSSDMAGGIGITTETADPTHQATALLNNSITVADGFYRYHPGMTSSEFVMETNYNTGGGVRQNELYWENESAYRPFQSRWQPVASIAETAVFGGFVVTGDGFRLAPPNQVLAEFYQSKPGDHTVLNIYNSDPISRGADIVIGGKVNSYEGKGWSVGNDLNSNGSQNFFITNRMFGTQALFIDQSNHVGIGTTAPTATLEVAPGGAALADHWLVRSSRRWKTNIQTIQDALGKVRKLRGVTYDWRDGNRQDIGLVAEEVGSVIPEIVTYESNGVDARSVDYQRLVAVLIEAVKEQDKEISQLRSEIEASKGFPEAGTSVPTN